MTLVASSRMYNVCEGAERAFDVLFRAVAERADVALEPIAHAPPAPLTALWQREDLGAAIMCGYPFASLPPEARPVPLAVLCPLLADGEPLYASHILVRAGDSAQRLGDLRGRRFGWTVRDSQSGYHAPREFLLAERGAAASAFFASTVGPLLNPTGILAALAQDRVDAGAVDAISVALLRRHEPERLRPFRILTTTPLRPAPLIVASRSVGADAVERLRNAFLSLGDDPRSRTLLERVALARFRPAAMDHHRPLLRAAGESAPPILAAW